MGEILLRQFSPCPRVDLSPVSRPPNGVLIARQTLLRCERDADHPLLLAADRVAVELHVARRESVQRMVSPFAHMLPCMVVCPSLPDDDVACEDKLACSSAVSSAASLATLGCAADSPPYFFVPRRLPVESLPFLDEPPPRLVAFLVCIRPGRGLECNADGRMAPALSLAAVLVQSGASIVVPH